MEGIGILKPSIPKIQGYQGYKTTLVKETFSQDSLRNEGFSQDVNLRDHLLIKRYGDIVRIISTNTTKPLEASISVVAFEALRQSINAFPQCPAMNSLDGLISAYVTASQLFKKHCINYNINWTHDPAHKKTIEKYIDFTEGLAAILYFKLTTRVFKRNRTDPLKKISKDEDDYFCSDHVISKYTFSRLYDEISKAIEIYSRSEFQRDLPLSKKLSDGTEMRSRLNESQSLILTEAEHLKRTVVTILQAIIELMRTEDSLMILLNNDIVDEFRPRDSEIRRKPNLDCFKNFLHLANQRSSAGYWVVNTNLEGALDIFINPKGTPGMTLLDRLSKLSNEYITSFIDSANMCTNTFKDTILTTEEGESTEDLACHIGLPRRPTPRSKAELTSQVSIGQEDLCTHFHIIELMIKFQLHNSRINRKMSTSATELPLLLESFNLSESISSLQDLEVEFKGTILEEIITTQTNLLVGLNRCIETLKNSLIKLIKQKLDSGSINIEAIIPEMAAYLSFYTPLKEWHSDCLSLLQLLKTRINTLYRNDVDRPNAIRIITEIETNDLLRVFRKVNQILGLTETLIAGEKSTLDFTYLVSDFTRVAKDQPMRSLEPSSKEKKSSLSKKADSAESLEAPSGGAGRGSSDLPLETELTWEEQIVEAQRKTSAKRALKGKTPEISPIIAYIKQLEISPHESDIALYRVKINSLKEQGKFYKVYKILTSIGAVEDHTTGSHCIYNWRGASFSVPKHKEIATGTLSSIARQLHEILDRSLQQVVVYPRK